MKFKKDGKVFDLAEAIFEYCKTAECSFCSICDAVKYTCGNEAKDLADLMGFEVIDEPTIGEIVAKHSEDDTPTIAETAAKRSEAAKRRLTRADILHAAEKCVCGQREQDYGTPEDNFETIAELWKTYLRRACVDEAGGVYIDANDVAMMMALLKIARIAAGGGKADSWIDLAGYAACGAECEGVTE
jgi:hypothetical protein